MDSVLEILVMAQLHFVEGLNYSEIANLHGVSVATVSRRIKEAREGGYVVETRRVVPPTEEIERAMYDHVTFERVGQHLLEALNERDAGLRRVIVVAGDLPFSVDDIAERERNSGRQRTTRVGKHAAALMAQQIDEMRKKRECLRIGVNWGPSVQMACKHFQEFAPANLLDMDNVTVSALSGLFWVDSNRTEQDRRNDLERMRRSWSVSATANAQMLIKAFPKSCDKGTYFIRLPALISEMTYQKELPRIHVTRDVLKNFCAADPGYRFLYGNKPIFPSAKEAEDFLSRRSRSYLTDVEEYGTILQHDILISGLSSLSSSAAFVHVGGPEFQKRIVHYREAYNACGDVASHIFTESGKIPRKDDPDCPEIGPDNARVLSLWPEDLMQVADLHRHSGPGGTIIVASGAKKARALMVAVTKLRVANYVVIDTNLAFKLYEELGLLHMRDEDLKAATTFEASSTSLGPEIDS